MSNRLHRLIEKVNVMGRIPEIAIASTLAKLLATGCSANAGSGESQGSVVSGSARDLPQGGRTRGSRPEGLYYQDR